MRSLVLSGLLLLSFFSTAQNEEQLLNKSMQLLRAMQTQKMESVAHLLDSSIISQMPVAAMNPLWNQFMSRSDLGTFRDTSGVMVENSNVFIGMKFEKGELDFKCIFNENEKIIGFFFAEPVSKIPYRLPDYAKPTLYKEISYTLQSDSFRLKGKLCLPEGKGPFPLVILAHGSGPNSMDEEMGPNKVFRDIAYGLASKGVAVFRYHKRTYQYGGKSVEHPDSFDFDAECIDDLIAAADTFSKDPRIAPDKIFLLGHSLTGYLAPRIAGRSGKFAGVIIAGGPLSPMDSLLLYQFAYLSSLDTSGTWLRPTEDLKKEVEYLRSEDFNRDSDPSWLPLGINALYWMDILAYKPVAEARQLDIRFLVLQGGDDYQVPVSEFELWKQGLKGRNAKFILYPGLGHGFFPSNGIKGPDQYDQQVSVEEKVIKDIAGFVKK